MFKPKMNFKTVRIIVGVACALIALILGLSLMFGSYGEWKTYYDAVIKEKEHQKYLQTLPLELLGISASLAEGVVYYDNDTADPVLSDFVVTANFTEKGRDFTKKLSVSDYTIDIPDDFALKGGSITVSYTWQPEKADDAGADDPMPDPVTKTTQVNITLVAPDETVFKLVQMPTYSQTGIAENINGEQKILPVLNDVNYVYSESEKEKLVRFVYEELDITIKKPLLAYLSFKLKDGSVTVEANNVNCYFSSDIQGMSVAYDEENSAFEISTEDGQTVEFSELTADNITISGGKVVLYKTLKTKALTVRSGAALRIQDVGTAIEATSILFERDSDVTCLTSGDSIQLKGSAKLLGKLEIRDQDGDTDKTGINVAANDSVIEFGETSRVTFDSFTYAIGRFGSYNNATVMLPHGTYSSAAGELGENERASWYIINGDGKQKILILKNLVNTYFCNTDIEQKSYEGLYTVVTAPTATTTGLATAEGMENIILPVLSKKDYAFTEKENNVVEFTHYATGLVFDITVDGARLTVDGVKYNSLTAVTHFSTEDVTVSYSDGTYTVTVAEGKTAEFGTISCDSLVLNGKGTLSLSSQSYVLNVPELKVMSGVVNIQGNSYALFVDSSMTIAEGAEVNVISPSDPGANMVVFNETVIIDGIFTCVNKGKNSVTAVTVTRADANMDITIGETAYVFIENFEVAFGVWTSEAPDGELHFPSGVIKATTQTDPDTGLSTFGYYYDDGQGGQNWVYLAKDIDWTYYNKVVVDVASA